MSVADHIRLNPFVGIALPFVCGLLLGDSVTGYPFLWTFVVAATTCVALSFFLTFPPKLPNFLSRFSFFHSSRMLESRMLHGILIYLAVFFVGAWYGLLVNRPLPLPRPQSYEAVVTSTPVVHGKVVMFDLVISDGPNAGAKIKASLLRDTLTHRWEQLRVGDGLRAFSTFSKPWSRPSEGHFNYARWMRIHDYAGTTFILPDDWQKAKVSLLCLSSVERSFIAALRFRSRLLSGLSANGQGGAVLAAMTLGDKAGLSKAIKNDFTVSGASHILALSGLHVGIIYMFFMFVCSPFQRKLSMLFTLVTIWAYVFVVGMSPSVVRAATMLTLCSVASLLGGSRMSLNVLALAAVIMLAFNPNNLFDVGFLLSFVAVLGIKLFYLPFAHSFHFRWWLPDRILRLCAISISAQLATMPLTLYYFGRFTSYFLLTNVVVIPLATLLIYGVVLLMFLSPFPPVFQVVREALLLLAEKMVGAVSWIASLPGASIGDIHFNRVQVVLLYVAMLSLLLAIGRIRRVSVRTWEC